MLYLAPREVYLGNQSGLLVGRDSILEKTDAACEIFADVLAKHESPASSNPFPFPSFATKNNSYLRNEARSYYDRSRGRLDARNFDIKSWYASKLKKLGNITSFSEAENVTEQLTLKFEDVFAGFKDIREELERDYPLEISIHGKSHPVEYNYISNDDESEESGTLYAGVKLGFGFDDINTGAKEFLSWPSNTEVCVGPASNRVKVTFNVRPRVGREVKGTNIKKMQEDLDWNRLSNEWDKYSLKNKVWKLKITADENDPFSGVQEKISDAIPPYATAINGDVLMPILGIDNIDLYLDRQQMPNCIAEIKLFRVMRDKEEREKTLKNYYATHLKKEMEEMLEQNKGGR